MLNIHKALNEIQDNNFMRSGSVLGISVYILKCWNFQWACCILCFIWSTFGSVYRQLEVMLYVDNLWPWAIHMYFDYFHCVHCLICWIADRGKVEHPRLKKRETVSTMLMLGDKFWHFTGHMPTVPPMAFTGCIFYMLYNSLAEFIIGIWV